GAVRGAARLVRLKITVKIGPKCMHFVLYFRSYLGVLNNYKKTAIMTELSYWSHFIFIHG
ncbi:MAG: hypothetical protein J6Y90_06530, partial [Lachnospiraceae bacterium]|nr:hypothetical protein [Lachnospiraceae bacterium]